MSLIKQILYIFLFCLPIYSYSQQINKESFNFIPIEKWHEGMKFSISQKEPNSKIPFWESKVPYENRDVSSMKTANTFKNIIFTFETFKKVDTIVGDKLIQNTYLCFLNEQGKKYEYLIGSNYESLLNGTSLTKDISNLVYLDDYLLFSTKGIGKKYKVINRKHIGRVDFQHSTLKDGDILECTDLKIGEKKGPFVVYFRDKNNVKYFTYTFFSKTNLSYINDDLSFFNRFSTNLSDKVISPQTKHLSIREHIQKGNIKIGMKKLDCIKIIGRPTQINTMETKSLISEQYCYPNYVYLYFDNGILVSFQY